MELFPFQCFVSFYLAEWCNLIAMNENIPMMAVEYLQFVNSQVGIPN